VAFNPQMLILARESRRMTQKALAEASGTAQSAVSKAEAGLVAPLAGSVAAWARALRYRVEMFSKTHDAPPPPRTMFRKRASLSQGDIKAIKASIAIQCMHVEWLARSIELPEPDVPLMTIGRDVGSATEAARYVRQSWRLAPGPIPNIVEPLEDHSIVVVPMQNRSDEFMGLSVHEHKRALPPIMFFNGDAPADRVRWTIAHELGHIVLHHHQFAVSEHCEDEADEFASEFLMPANEIRHHFSSRTDLNDLAQLKLHWRVSMQSLLSRALAVGRITKSQSTRMWKLISMYGYRRCEPNGFPLEQPGLLAEMVRVHIGALDFSLEDLCDLLGIEAEEVRSLYRSDLPTPSPTATSDAKSGPRLRLVE
jgi:Zn-dependent peptidase ImmA (M78 family)